MYRLDVWLHTNPSYTWFSESITLWRMGTLWILSGKHLLLSATAPGHIQWCIKGDLYCSLSVLKGSGGLPELRLAFVTGIQMS